MDVRISAILLACIIQCAVSSPIQVFYSETDRLENYAVAKEDILKAIGQEDPGKTETQDSMDIYSSILEANKDIRLPTREGDIIQNPGRNAINCPSCLWPKSDDGTVPVPYNFSYSYNADQLALFKTAMQEFETLTCVRFVPWTTEDDFLNIMSNGGCASLIGKSGGSQIVWLDASGCMSKGIIQHELNHALGFYHEQNRSDRDDYVIIHPENIIPDYLSNFDKYDTNNLGTEYDYNSVMHYARDAFSSNGNITIEPKPDPNVPIGQRNGLSTLDISKINKLYECGVCSNLLAGTSGTIISANYPSAYPNNSSCVWLLRTPSGQVTLQFQAFDIQSSTGCVSDYIKIYDGPTKTSPVLMDRACGTGLIPIQIASTNQMLVEFVSDGAVTGTGFKATYSSVQCGGAFYASTKTFTSPGYPGSYPPNIDCTWTITAPVGNRVSLRINYFQLETVTSCTYDYVNIYNSTLNAVMGPYCGPMGFQSPFVSKSNSMMIKMHTDDSNNYRGFSATYTFVK
ncbi:embryonic protein UVS.2 isoform X5 [Xenopus tropicalis]|uniref:Metalloendopeptidase n=1 Tax=Xenopus tropicalis TaxID=8364 RepID=A0A8J1IMK7_XENTR|nr:embryonic protein UVS.2 isoform X5 [Xenopus tropicalis]